MIIDGVSLAAQSEGEPDVRAKAIGAAADLFERKLGVKVVYDVRELPFERADLIQELKLAETLRGKGVITTYFPVQIPADEPQIKLWNAMTPERDTPTGGGTWNNDRGALMAALAEGIERSIWWGESDYFSKPVRCSTKQMARYGAHIPPKRFAGFSKEQREKNPRWQFDDATPFLWIRGTSLVSGKRVYLPAQTISSADGLFNKEPLIRQRITIGLATWPEKTPALLAGALECVEREAYMIMWLNQLALPRVELSSVMETSPSLAEFVEACERYRYKVHAIKLSTDAPTHAICVVLEDLSGKAPRFSFGLKAHRSLAYAIEKSMIEALRAHMAFRKRATSGSTNWVPGTPLEKIGHMDRIFYWGEPENAKRLQHLISGKEERVEKAPWENDTPEEHLARVVQWCRVSGFECAYVSLGSSKRNPTPFSVEMVVIPELQSTHLNEHLIALGGTRWKEVPKKFGLRGRDTPYTEAPHPFA